MGTVLVPEIIKSLCHVRTPAIKIYFSLTAVTRWYMSPHWPCLSTRVLRGHSLFCHKTDTSDKWQGRVCVTVTVSVSMSVIDLFLVVSGLRGNMSFFYTKTN